MADGGPLVCPRCARPHDASERFCSDCGLPLTYAQSEGDEPLVSEAHARARKIKPQYSEGDLVRVAGARHQAEAELIQGLLLEEGVPSMLRRTRGFDVPDMLAAGPRDVLVPASGADAAREVLLEAKLIDGGAGTGPVERPARLFAVLCLVVAVVAVIAWLGADVF